jgi:hypothetical protein
MAHARAMTKWEQHTAQRREYRAATRKVTHLKTLNTARRQLSKWWEALRRRRIASIAALRRANRTLCAAWDKWHLRVEKVRQEREVRGLLALCRESSREEHRRESNRLKEEERSWAAEVVKGKEETRKLYEDRLKQEAEGIHVPEEEQSRAEEPARQASASLRLVTADRAHLKASSAVAGQGECIMVRKACNSCKRGPRSDSAIQLWYLGAVEKQGPKHLSTSAPKLRAYAPKYLST